MRRVISLYLPHWPSDRLRRMRREFAARDKPLVTAMMQGNAGPTAAALDRVRAQLDRPWPELIEAGSAAVGGPSARREVRIPLERAALLSLGRAGGAVTGRSAAFLEGWLPDEG